MKNVIKQLLAVLDRRQKWECILIFITSFVGSMIELLGITAILPFAELLLKPDEVMNYSFGKYISIIFKCETSNQVIVIAGVLIIVVYIAKNVYLFEQFKFQIRKINNIRWNLTSKVIKSYMDREYLFFTQTNSSILLRGIDLDISATTDVMSNLFRAFAEVITVSAIVIYLLYTNIFMSLMIASVSCICLLWFLFKYRKKVRKVGREYNEYAAIVSQCALQMFRGIKEIKVMHREDFFVRRYVDLLQARINTESKKGIYEKKPPYLYEAVCVSAFAGAVCVLVGFNIQIDKLIPEIAVFAVSAFRIISSTGRISSSLNGAMFSREGLNNAYNNILYLKKDINAFGFEAKYQDEKVNFQNTVEIKNLYWSYPGRESRILYNINFCIKKGEAVAFVGVSGAGKTTLADIILGLLRPTEGDVMVDGRSIFSIPERWSEMVGYVPQNAYLADDTIRNNVAYGVEESEIDDDKVKHALKQAQIWGFVNELEEGIGTIIGEAGIRFSGGQRQRIAIARALYYDPDILVLDEATSALDSETEKALMDSIENLYGKKTLIIIAHRLSTIQKCDKVYEIVNGNLHCIKTDN